MSDIEAVRHRTLFDTAIGRCGVAWAGETILATHLPEETDEQTVARLVLRAGGATDGEPPPAVAQVIAAMTALLAGERVDLSFVACDLDGLDPFRARVYRLARAVPRGETVTYGEIASRLGDRSLAQAVGQALGRNPLPIIVPCHRVLGAKGRLTGFSAAGGLATKLHMLAIEGVQLGEPPGLFDTLPLAVRPARGDATPSPALKTGRSSR